MKHTIEGQISIFDLMKTDISEWERFRDNYCKRQTAILCFNEMGKKDKDGKPQKACCFRNKRKDKPWDNWQRCTYDNCCFIKGVSKFD